MERRSYTLREVAEATGLSVRTLRALIHRGDLAAVKAGKRLIVTGLALDAFLHGSTNDGQTA